MHTYPIGPRALHRDWPDARFNVSGLFIYDDLILNLIRLVQDTLNCRLPIASLHGSPPVPWNAGRIMPPRVPNPQQPSPDVLASMNLGCQLTFTNHLLTERDLQDPAGNALLDILARRPDLNGVIVNSDLLSRHIARRHPNLPQIASITKVAIENGRGNAAYYKELGQRFHRYVVHPDDVHNPRLLEQLDRAKAEILINETCVRDCALRARHYDLIAQAQKSPAATSYKGECLQPADPPAAVSDTQRDCALAHSEMKALYDMGFRNFKLQGRAAQFFFILAYDIAYYMLEPDFAAPSTCRWLLKNPNFLRGADGSMPGAQAGPLQVVVGSRTASARPR